ncbi:hypothetical protein MNBD_DELTA01-1888 [hydrothermal vent metagenome]|uniref:Uncharacterized protein n=1 Tax=hydrothermal vent metagenome TaxID=652676 RepID=A0A3B0RJV9_9ZZZZ
MVCKNRRREYLLYVGWVEDIYDSNWGAGSEPCFEPEVGFE